MTYPARREALKKLAAEFDIDITGDPPSNSSDEDLREYFGGLLPSSWAAITVGGETGTIYYIYPCHDDKDEAIAHAVEHANDGIYAEAPFAVVNLDTGARYTPAWNTLQFRKAA